MKLSVYVEPTGRTYSLKKSKRAFKQIDRDRVACKKARIKLRRIFAPALKALAASLAKQISAKIGKVDQSEIDRILADLDMSDLVELVGNIDDVLAELTADGAFQALVQIGMNDNASIVNQANDRAVAWANDRAAEMVGKKWVDGELVDNPNAKWSIEESTREMLRADVADAIDQGWSNDTLADNLAESYAFSDERAMTIARTETAFADVAGNVEAYQASGIVSGKEWITADDDKVSDECQGNADEGVIAFEDEFSSGAMWPPEHPNCRCDVVPSLTEVADDNSADDETDAGKFEKYSEDQPRASNGQFGSGGGEKEVKESKPAFVSDNPKDYTDKAVRAQDIEKLPEDRQEVLTDMYDKAAENKNEFDAKNAAVAELVGGKAAIVGLKGSERAVEKTIADYKDKLPDGTPDPNGKPDPSQVKDLLRTTIEVNSLADVAPAVAALRATYGEPSKFKDTLDVNKKSTQGGYRDVNMVVSINGSKAEIQVNVKGMLEAKSHYHAQYEIVRKIDALVKSENRTMTAAEHATRSTAMHTQRVGYNRAWAKITG